jgi:dolichol-phosphate mannosyltransferase
VIRWLWFFVAAVQATLALRVVARLARTARGEGIGPARVGMATERVSVIVPVLDEAERLGSCLAGLHAQGAEVAEILVVDGGSTDATRELVLGWAARDRRIRLVEAGPAADDANGKVHNLAAGLAVADPAVPWLLTIDADVRPRPGLARALLAFATARRLGALSVATLQRVSGPAEALLHPAMLTTLVYRFGIPGSATIDPALVQANGQCMLLRRDLLEAVGGFTSLAGEIVEDVAIARRLAARGEPVGFYEAGPLVEVAMYRGAAEAWRNWTRSLPMRDARWGWAGRIGLLEVLLVQALPLPLLLWLAVRGRSRTPLGRLNLVLALVRIGVLAGAARAYVAPPFTYWLSPVSDPAVALALPFQAIRRRHVWRGRSVVRGGSR